MSEGKIEQLCRLLERLGVPLQGSLHYIGGSDTLPAPLTRAEESRLLAALGQMFTYRPTPWVDMIAANVSVLYGLFFLPLGLVWMLPLPKKLRLSESGSPAALAANNLLHLVLAGVCVVAIISSKYNPFIYFRF